MAVDPSRCSKSPALEVHSEKTVVGVAISDRFANRDQAGSAAFDYIEGFYNAHRPHSAIGYHSPANYERTTQPTIETESQNRSQSG